MTKKPAPPAPDTTSAARRSPAKKTAAPRARPTQPRRGAGSVERATFLELRTLAVLQTAAGAAAVAMAKQVDNADSPSGAAAASRELRMALMTARSLGRAEKPLSPAAAAEDAQDDGVVVPGSRLAELRQAASARSGR